MNRRHLLITILFSLSACAENSDDRARGTEQQLDLQRITRTRLPLEVAAVVAWHVYHDTVPFLTALGMLPAQK